MRKMIAFILAVGILLPFTYAATENKTVLAASGTTEKIIQALDIMQTDKGEIKKNTTGITRAQYAQLLVNLSGQEDSIAASNVTLFRDVTRKYWAAPYIKEAVNRGWMTGYLDGTFRPSQKITLMEAVSGVLNLLGYDNSYFNGNLVQSKLALYKAKELDTNVTVSKATSYLSYENCINLFYNVLNATNKEGKIYAQVLGYSLNSKNEIDYLSVINTETEGPVIATDSWTKDIPFSITNATFYKNDEKSNYTSIRKYDVLYYSESGKTVWAYDNKVTGIISEIKPDLINPTSIVVAGVAYEFETSTASAQIATQGQYETGDVATLLLGKNGAVAGIIGTDEYNTTVTGVVLSVDTHLAKNDHGDYVSTGYVTYVDAAGNKYTQDYDDTRLTFEEEDLIRITYKNGKGEVSKLAEQNTGWGNLQASANGRQLGDKKLAANVSILDYSGGSYIKVYPIRLSNAIIMDNDILYYATNADGEITELILKDMTGDLDSYGIFTGFTYTGGSSAYHYILNGKASALSKASFGDFTIKEGPVGLSYEDGSIDSSYSLTEVTVKELGTTTITSGSLKYPLSEKLSVYVLSDDVYNLSSLDKINTSKYIVKAYYDKAITLGGRIRVIVAEPIN